jgi:hypothetical protein
MVRARINRGRVEAHDPIPPAWDGQMVKLIPLTPEDPVPELDQRIAALHAMGPMQFEPGERQKITAGLNEMNRLSIEAMNHPPRCRR